MADTYDANGNMLTGDGATYIYDARDRQSSYVKGSTLASYTYYPTGLRKSKLAGGVNTNFLWDGGNMICEYTDSPTSGKVYVYGLTLISQEDLLYYIYNAHGDVVKYINSSGTVLKTYDYNAFGEEVNASSTDANPFRYAGQYFDTETGTYYLRARYYSPAMGRFTQQDAWGYGDPSDPLSLNLYVYCINNPIMFFDPTGHQRVAGYYTINGVYGWYDDPDASEFGIDSDTYKIINDLGNRWWAAEDDAERDHWHQMAEKAREHARAGTSYKYGQDVIIETMHNNVLYAQEQVFNQWWWQGMHSALETYLYSYLWFVHMTCNDWDYKWNNDWRIPYNSYEGYNLVADEANGGYRRNWMEWIYFDGQVMGADKFGNLNLGYVGYRMGFIPIMLNNFATSGMGDGFWIDYGITMAKNGR